MTDDNFKLQPQFIKNPEQELRLLVQLEELHDDPGIVLEITEADLQSKEAQKILTKLQIDNYLDRDEEDFTRKLTFLHQYLDRFISYSRDASHRIVLWLGKEKIDDSLVGSNFAYTDFYLDDLDRYTKGYTYYHSDRFDSGSLKQLDLMHHKKFRELIMRISYSFATGTKEGLRLKKVMQPCLVTVAHLFSGRP